MFFEGPYLEVYYSPGIAVNLNVIRRVPCLNTKICFLFILVMAGLLFSPIAYADGIPLILRGVGRTIFSVLEIPKDMLINSTRAFPLGLIGGTLTGVMKAVAGTVVGAADIARGAAPYAKYLVFL